MELAKIRYTHSIEFVYSHEQGMGIAYWTDGHDWKVFYEDGKVYDYKGVFSGYNSFDHIVRNLEDRLRYNEETLELIEKEKKKASVSFVYNSKNVCSKAELTYNGKIYIIELESRYWEIPCSCRRNNCLHYPLVLSMLKDRIAALENMYLESAQPVIKSLFMKRELCDSIDKSEYARLSKDDIGIIKKAAALIKEYDDSYIEGALTYYINLYDDFYEADLISGYRYLFAAFAADERIRNVITVKEIAEGKSRYEDRQQKSNRLVLKRAIKEYDKAYGELYGKKKNDTPYDMKEFILKYNGDTAGLLSYYAALKPEIQEIDAPYIDEICSCENSDHSMIAAVIEKIDSDYSSLFDWQSEIFHKLLKTLTPDESLEACSRLKKIKLDKSIFKELPPENAKKLLNCIAVTPSSVQYALDTILKDESDSVKGQFILAKLPEMTGRGCKDYIGIVEGEAAKLSHNTLLLACIAEHLNSGHIPDVKTVSEEDLSMYFEPEYCIEEEETGFNVIYSVLSPGTGRIEFQVLEKNGSFRFTVNPLKSRNHYSPQLVKNYCTAGREHEFNYAVEKAREAESLRKFNIEHEDFTKEYIELCENLKETKIMLSQEKKAQIEYSFYTGKRTGLMFRVGNTKSYIVKNGSEFIKAFISGETVTYGKDLILTHNLENLNEDDAGVMKFLISARYSVSTSSDAKLKRYIYLSDATAANLISLLKGRRISIDEEPVNVRLEEITRRVKVDDSFVLGTTIDAKKERLICLTDRAFIIKDEQGEKYLDSVALPPAEIKLLDFAERQSGTSIKPILGDFKRNIYSKFFDFIDVPPALLRSFRLGDIKINAYFDYEKGAVTLNAEYIKNGQSIPENLIADNQDLARVRSFRDYIASLGFDSDVLSDEAGILSFFKMDFSDLKKLCNVYLSDSLKNKQLLTVNRETVRIQYDESGIMQAFMEKSDYTEEELKEILAALRKKKKYIILKGDRIVDLDNDKAKELAETVKDLGLDEKALYKKKEIAMVTAIKAFAHERNCRPDAYLRNMIEEIRHYKDADFKLPKLNAELKEYQADGYRWLKVLSKYRLGGILADDMGLGKTLQMIALIKSDTEKKPSIIVCPKSLLFNWDSEFRRFDGETQTVRITGGAQQRAAVISSIDYCKKAVYITSYDSLRNDIELYKGGFNYAILDEAQYIKNVKAQKTQSVKELKAVHRFAVTGTPIENSVIDLWSIFDYIMPGLLEELSEFADTYSKDLAFSERLAQKTGPFILKRLKADVLTDLPPKYERILSADMRAEQRKLYDAMCSDARKQMESGKKVFDMLPFITRLRQVCVDPAMFAENYKGGSGKIDLLREMIPKYIEEGHRILVFSQFVQGLKSLEAVLTEEGIPYYMLTGDTSASDRAAMADNFNNGGEADVFLISLKAGGTGLNLTGADTVIHLDPWWNLAAENQATDRTHRIGQQKNVEVIKLISENSIEQRVIELQQIKKEVAESVISGDDSAITNATLENIAYILK